MSQLTGNINNMADYRSKPQINLKIKDRVLNALAEECSSPMELIKTVMTLKGMTYSDLGKIIGKTGQHLAVVLNNDTLGSGFLYEVVEGLEINPTIVFRCWADWKLKLEQEAHAKINK